MLSICISASSIACKLSTSSSPSSSETSPKSDSELESVSQSLSFSESQSESEGKWLTPPSQSHSDSLSQSLEPHRTVLLVLSQSESGARSEFFAYWKAFASQACWMEAVFCFDFRPIVTRLRVPASVWPWATQIFLVI